MYKYVDVTEKHQWSYELEGCMLKFLVLHGNLPNFFLCQKKCNVFSRQNTNTFHLQVMSKVSGLFNRLWSMQ